MANCAATHKSMPETLNAYSPRIQLMVACRESLLVIEAFARHVSQVRVRATQLQKCDG